MTSQGDIWPQNGDVDAIMNFQAQGIVHKALNMVDGGNLVLMP